MAIRSCAISACLKQLRCKDIHAAPLHSIQKNHKESLLLSGTDRTYRSQQELLPHDAFLKPAKLLHAWHIGASFQPVSPFRWVAPGMRMEG